MIFCYEISKNKRTKLNLCFDGEGGGGGGEVDSIHTFQESYLLDTMKIPNFGYILSCRNSFSPNLMYKKFY